MDQDKRRWLDWSGSLWIKPTDALNSSFIGITTIHVSGSLSAHHQEFLAVHRLWYILCSCDVRLLPGVGWNCLLPIKLEYSASVGFIHKESVTMHDHTIVKFTDLALANAVMNLGVPQNSGNFWAIWDTIRFSKRPPFLGVCYVRI
jgi:hypothetical protein